MHKLYESVIGLSKYVSLFQLCKGLFTRSVCMPVCVNVCINGDANTHAEIGFQAILCFNVSVTINTMLKVDIDINVDVNAHVKCKQGLMRCKKLLFHLPSHNSHGSIAHINHRLLCSSSHYSWRLSNN